MDITSHSLAVLRATLLIAAPIAMSPGAAGSDIPSFAPVLVTDGVYVIYGPLGLPDENNRGFRNNVAIVDTAAGAVVLDPGGSAWAGEQIAAAVDAVLLRQSAGLAPPASRRQPSATPCAPPHAARP